MLLLLLLLLLFLLFTRVETWAFLVIIIVARIIFYRKDGICAAATLRRAVNRATVRKRARTTRAIPSREVDEVRGGWPSLYRPASRDRLGKYKRRANSNQTKYQARYRRDCNSASLSLFHDASH